MNKAQAMQAIYNYSNDLENKLESVISKQIFDNPNMGDRISNINLGVDLFQGSEMFVLVVDNKILHTTKCTQIAKELYVSVDYLLDFIQSINECAYDSTCLASYVSMAQTVTLSLIAEANRQIGGC